MKKAAGRVFGNGKAYSVVVEYDPREPGPNKYAAFVPDMPGCQTDGRSRKEVIDNIKDAIKLYLSAEPVVRNRRRAERLTVRV